MEKNESEMITIYVMGKKHLVPADLTIMKAMEYAGHQFKRGAGCRGGFCGACATIYRTKGSYKLQGALACQKIVEDGMYIAQIPFCPAEKKTYDIGELRPEANTFLEYYPEIARCLSCNTCTKACPQDIQVMDYVQAALRGDVEEAAKLSFDCLSCGLCAVRCPAEIVPYNIAQLARRLYSRYVVGPTEHVLNRVEEVEAGDFDAEIEELKGLETAALRERYNKREMRV
ncbi:MAG: 4Fe-4S dicluster domain-containing protein [Candidatus Bathyarchaeota archaeon]|nr:4Fe-4S dicluster domain-containing protein [Candidatus Bathyarchaeota archaeon]MDH5790887.1 4Fe-4S dicluster domain-containing protein [Candidatus Bathyarchaeota archaeon]